MARYDELDELAFNQQSKNENLTGEEAVNVWGVVSLIFFYLIILAIGVWAALNQKNGKNKQEDIVLANR